MPRREVGAVWTQAGPCLRVETDGPLVRVDGIELTRADRKAFEDAYWMASGEADDWWLEHGEAIVPPA